MLLLRVVIRTLGKTSSEEHFLVFVFSFAHNKASFVAGPNNLPLPMVVPTGTPCHNRCSGMGDITPRVPVVKPPMRVF